MYKVLAILTVLCLTAAAFCEDAAPAVAAAAPVALDATAKWIGYVWAGLTSAGVLLTAIAAVIRQFAPTSAIAAGVDAIAHFASAVGTSVRPSQYTAPKQ